MALTAKSLFLYGFEINEFNSSIDFRTTFGGTIYQATVDYGYYTFTQLKQKIKLAMEAAQPAYTFAISMDRSISSGESNRVSFNTSAGYLELLFLTGPRNATSIDQILGFNHTDYTGASFYVGSTNAGTILIPELVGYSYLGPEHIRKVFGALNVSADGTKEALVWSVQRFFEVEFKHEPSIKVITEWVDLMTWMIQQKPIEFTPMITTHTVFYEATLESSPADGKGLGYKLIEMLPDFPFDYKTGMLNFRQIL